MSRLWADTFDANLSYMSISRPLVSVMENVEALDDAVDTGDQRFQSNLKQVEAALKKNGFIVMSILLSSNKYGLPQMRKRFYILATPLETNVAQQAECQVRHVSQALRWHFRRA